MTINMNPKKLIILCMTGIALLSVVGYFVFVKIQPITQQSASSDGYTHVVEPADDHPVDYKIVRISNRNGEREVLVPNVTQTAKLTGLTGSGKTLFPFAVAENSNKIFFNEATDGSDAGSHLLWSFDISTKQLTKLTNINSVFGGFDGIAISPNKLYVVTALADEGKNDKGISQNLKLLDLNNDLVKTIVTLSGDETLNAGYTGLSSNFDIKFLDDSTVQYNVYDQSMAPIESGRYFNGAESYKPLLGTRIITVE